MPRRKSNRFDRFDAEARRCLALAQRKAARQFGHDSIDEAHIALGLLAARGRASRILEALDCQSEDVAGEIESILIGQPRKDDKPGFDLSWTPFAPRARALLELSLEQAEKLVGSDGLLLTILSEEWRCRSTVARVFEGAGITYQRVLGFVGTRTAEGGGTAD